MRIAQISDLHVTDKAGGMRRFVDSNANASLAVRQLAAHVSNPDVVIVTGDLVDEGTEAEYALLREVLEPIDRPMYVLPGNHDDRRVLETALPDFLPNDRADGHCSYAIDDHEVRLVAIDTTVPGRHDGVFPEDRAAWLDATLGAVPDQPTLVFMHFPPFETGIWWMDAIGMSGKERFAEVLAGHHQVGLIVCGHIHRSIQTRIAHATVSVCPSTAHQVGLALDPSVSPVLTDEPPGFQIHTFTGNRFITHTAALPWSGRTVDLDSLLALPETAVTAPD